MRTENLAGDEVGAVAVIVGPITIRFEPMGGEMAKIDEKNRVRVGGGGLAKSGNRNLSRLCARLGLWSDGRRCQ